MKDLAQTFWIAFDKKQPDYPEFISFLQTSTVTDCFDEIYLEEIGAKKWGLVVNFKRSLQKIVTIEMLVAMKDGEVLEPPMTFDYRSENGSVPKYPQELYEEAVKDYQQAMESVLYDIKNLNPLISKTNVSLRFNDFEISLMKNEQITLNWWKEVLK